MRRKNLTIFCSIILTIVMGMSGPAQAIRIVSLAPSITEILFLLNLGDKTVGVTANCDYPAAARRIDKIGLFGSPNLEGIVALKPDLVLAPDLGDNAALFKLRELKIATVILPSRNLAEVLASIVTVGGLAGKKEEAKSLAAKMRTEIEGVKQAAAGRFKPRVLVVLWANPNLIVTAGRKSFIGEMINLAGGNNIADGMNAGYPMIGPEFILAADPEVVILGGSDDNKNNLKILSGFPGLKNTRAVKSGRIYGRIDSDLFLRPGPRLIEGLKKIAGILHPEIFGARRASR